MQITPATVYWIMMLDSLKWAAFCLFFTSTGIGIVSVIVMQCELSKKICVLGWSICFLLFLCTCCSLFIPDTRTVCAMYAIPKITNSETFEEISKDGVEVVRLGLKSFKQQLNRIVKD